MGLSSQHVLTFIPLNTWTPVFTIPNNELNNNGIYIISTKDKLLKRFKDMYEITLNVFTFKKVNTFKLMGLVAVEIKGLWCRGRMLSYNEFLFKNTVVELIDSGSIVKKQLCDLYQLPDDYAYDPLCLSVKPVNEIISLKFGQFCVQPLLLQSELQKGYVVVNTKPIDLLYDIQIYSEITLKLFNMKEQRSSITANTNNKCAIKKSKFNSHNNLNIQELNKFKIYKKERDFEYKSVIELSNELKEVFNTEKKIYLNDLLYNVNTYKLNNICIQLVSNVPKCLSLKYINLNDNLVFLNKLTELEQYNIKNITNVEPLMKNEICTIDLHISEHNLFKNGSFVEFCYGRNIDFVYIRSYEEKQKYSFEMKMFYAYYIEKENLKIKTELNIGDMVAALSYNFKKIHRAVILRITNEQKYLCFFVDIGCKEYVNSNNIFELLEEVKNVPYLAHKVRLKNDPFNNTMKLKRLKKYFVELSFKPLIIEFDELDSNKIKKVILKNKLNNMNIYLEVNELIQKELLDNGVTEPLFIKYLNNNDLLKNGTVVFVTHFISIHKVYVRIGTSELTEYYDTFIGEIQKYYNNFEGLYNKKTINIGEKVSVKSPSMKKFSRAIIIKKIDNMTYLVYYLDYGYEECVKTENIFFLSYRFCHVPQTVYKIGLNDYNIKVNTKICTSYFNKLIQSFTPLIIDVDEDDPLSFKNVTLKKNGINILYNLPK